MTTIGCRTGGGGRGRCSTELRTSGRRVRSDLPIPYQAGIPAAGYPPFRIFGGPRVGGGTVATRGKFPSLLEMSPSESEVTSGYIVHEDTLKGAERAFERQDERLQHLYDIFTVHLKCLDGGRPPIWNRNTTAVSLKDQPNSDGEDCDTPSAGAASVSGVSVSPAYLGGKPQILRNKYRASLTDRRRHWAMTVA